MFDFTQVSELGPHGPLVLNVGTIFSQRGEESHRVSFKCLRNKYLVCP